MLFLRVSGEIETKIHSTLSSKNSALAWFHRAKRLPWIGWVGVCLSRKYKNCRCFCKTIRFGFTNDLTYSFMTMISGLHLKAMNYWSNLNKSRIFLETYFKIWSTLARKGIITMQKAENRFPKIRNTHSLALIKFYPMLFEGKKIATNLSQNRAWSRSHRSCYGCFVEI